MNGTLFRSTDVGGYFLGDLNTDLKLDLHTALFSKNRIAVEFNTFQLSGGASRIDIATHAAIPASTSLNYEIYLDGRWQTLALDGTGPTLASLPPVVRLRAVFSGTSDLMPGMSITPSEVRLYREDTQFTWISDIKIPITSAEQIRLAAQLENWTAAENNINCYILTGSGYTTVETADVTETVTIENGVVQRTWTFSGISPGVSSYRVKITGSISALNYGFHVAKLIGSEFSLS